jgi:hypothetical protein
MKGSKQPAGHEEAAVTGELYQVFSGIAVRSGKYRVQAPVDYLSAFSMKCGQNGLAGGLGSKTGYHPCRHVESTGAAEPDYG